MTLPLDVKVRDARAVLRAVLEEHGPERTAVAWTAGKDSTVVLWLWRSLLLKKKCPAPLLALNLDTGVKFPEIVSLRDTLAAQWGVGLHVFAPGFDLRGYPVARNTLECCRDLKVEPLRRGLRELGVRALLTGLRRDEHPDRAGREVLEARQDPEHVQVNPILEWTEMDVWAFTMEQNLPYCPLYDQGYRSLGCMPCTKPAESAGEGGERSGRDRDKESRMIALRSLGYF